MFASFSARSRSRSARAPRFRSSRSKCRPPEGAPEQNNPYAQPGAGGRRRRPHDTAMLTRAKSLVRRTPVRKIDRSQLAIEREQQHERCDDRQRAEDDRRSRKAGELRRAAGYRFAGQRYLRRSTWSRSRTVRTSIFCSPLDSTGKVDQSRSRATRISAFACRSSSSIWTIRCTTTPTRIITRPRRSRAKSRPSTASTRSRSKPRTLPRPKVSGIVSHRDDLKVKLSSLRASMWQTRAR